MRVWMSKKARENTGYAARIVLPIVGSAVLACTIVIGGMVFGGLYFEAKTGRILKL